MLGTNSPISICVLDTNLVEGAVSVVGRVSVLLQEVVLEQLGHLERDLVRLGQRRLSDELDDLREVLLLLQDLVDLGAEGHELGEVLLVVVVEGAGVLGVRDQPGVGKWIPLSLNH